MFLNRFIGEMAEIFPDAYFHIGGDEVNGEGVDREPAHCALHEAKGFEKPSQLQTYFSQRVVRIVEQAPQEADRMGRGAGARHCRRM